MNFLFNLNPVTNLLIITIVTVLLFRLCYFLDGFSKFPISNLIAIFALMFIAVFMSLKTLSEVYHFRKLKEGYSLTEGKITYFKPDRGRKKKGEVNYEYMVRNELILNNVTGNDFVKFPKIKLDTTITYLVIYEQKSPENSFLLFNYPIKKNEDMQNYQKLFAKEIPKDAFNY
ncbi:hypothetical protein [Flavobacterium sp. N2038]|uniref:hypothetical protein n=1 Tax=Flavobacterium sp. N2038 TaxID=2986829 RepID=UPI002223F2B0|nr:hypothetical protein [Flavobacterium sp. N2038]